MNAQVKPPAVTFAEAFVKLQAAIKPAVKDSTNPHFRSKYADLGAVWEAVKGPLTEHGFAVIQAPDFEGDNMFLRTIILHASGEQMEGRYPLKPSKQDPQGYGSAITYARRYSVGAMLGVISEDDDDGNAASAPRPVAAPQTQREAMHTPKTMQPEDDDVVKGTLNWVNDQKTGISAVIENGGGMEAMQSWLDKNGGSFDKPKSGSNLDRLKRKFPDAFRDLHNHYITKLNEV